MTCSRHPYSLLEVNMAAEGAAAAVGVLALKNFHTVAVKEPVKSAAAAVILEPPGEWSEKDYGFVVIKF